MRIAVFGASGFVGTTLIEQLLEKDPSSVVPIIRGAGSAGRLARRGDLELRSVDIMERKQIKEALKGITHVVNCTRGLDEVMLKGLSNLLAECRAADIQRFVHLSSVAVHGDPPSANSTHENGTTEPAIGGYGWVKLQQDNMVERAHRDGLDCAILCPPNISGAYSGFVCNVLNDMRSGNLALVDGGAMPMNVVDVENLAYAIQLALEAEKVDGKRIFITDGDPISWKDFTDELLPLAELDEPLPSVTRDEFSIDEGGPRKGSLFQSFKHLVSSDVREAIRLDPNLEKVDMFFRGLVAKMGTGFEGFMRRGVEGALKVEKVGGGSRYVSHYNPQQLRGVRHEIDRAREILGYTPMHTFAESMAIFRRWYEAMNGFKSPTWPLVRELEGFVGVH